MKTKWLCPAIVALAISFQTVAAQESGTSFDEPVFLKIDDKPLNEDGSMMYPSPVMIDIDNDGADELVIGTIFGAVFVCENQNPGAGEPVWSAPEAVNTVSEEPLKLNNW